MENQAIEKRYLDRRLMFDLLDRLFPDNYMVDVREREMSLFAPFLRFVLLVPNKSIYCTWEWNTLTDLPWRGQREITGTAAQDRADGSEEADRGTCIRVFDGSAPLPSFPLLLFRSAMLRYGWCCMLTYKIWCN